MKNRREILTDSDATDSGAAEASYHRGTCAPSLPQTVLQLWLIVYRTELTVSLCV